MIAQAFVILPGMALFSTYCAALNDGITAVLEVFTERLLLSGSVAPEPPPAAPPTKRASLIKRLSAIGFPIQYRYGSLVEVGVPQGKFAEHPVERCCRDPNSDISCPDSVGGEHHPSQIRGADDPGMQI